MRLDATLALPDRARCTRSLGKFFKECESLQRELKRLQVQVETYETPPVARHRGSASTPKRRPKVQATLTAGAAGETALQGAVSIARDAKCRTVNWYREPLDDVEARLRASAVSAEWQEMRGACLWRP